MGEQRVSADVLTGALGSRPRVAVLGVGMMGMAVVGVALDRLAPSTLTLVDIDVDKATRLAETFAGSAASTALLPVPDLAAAGPVDVVIACTPWSAVEALLTTPGNTAVPVVSITRPPVSEANKPPAVVSAYRGSVALPIGLEPGLTEVVLADLVRQFDTVTTAEILCGGVTTRRPEGFPYRLLFGGRTLPFAARPAFRIEAGRRLTIARFDGVRPAALPDLPDMESYHDGMLPWLGDLAGLSGADVEQRTVRWPGFAESVRTLRQSGLLDASPTEVGSLTVSPLALTEQVLGRRLARRADEREVSHLQVTVTGREPSRSELSSRRVNVWCRDDDTTVGSGMGILTAVPAVEAARLLLRRRCSGWVRPDTLFGAADVNELASTLRRHGAHWQATSPAVSQEEVVDARLTEHDLDEGTTV